MVAGMFASGTLLYMIVSIDSGDAILINNGTAAPAPWSPHGTVTNLLLAPADD